MELVALHHTVREHRAAIVQLVAKRVLLAPVIIIVNCGHDQLQKELKKVEVPTMNLHKESFTSVESLMGTFNKKQEGTYMAFVIDEEQGRGLDFASSTDIEANGGVHVVVGSLPAHYLQFRQFIGRTGRIGNRGSYSVVLYDKEARLMTPESYLQLKLAELKNQDILHYVKNDEVK